MVGTRLNDSNKYLPINLCFLALERRKQCVPRKPQFDILNDAVGGQYLAIEQTMSQKSVRKHFASDSYKLIPKLIDSYQPDHRGASYYKSETHENCDIVENCP